MQVLAEAASLKRSRKKFEVNSNKKSTTVRAVPPPVNRQTGSGQFKPAVAQLKTGISAQSIKRPVAPPVYRPKTTPNAAQPKMASGAVNRKLPIAPPVYRPQQVPKVLQTKSSSAPKPPALANNAHRVAPASSKPRVVSKIIQRASDESKNLQNLGKMWEKIAEQPKASKAKKRFFEHAGEIKEKLGFSIYTVWHKHDPYVGGGKNKNYKKIVAALQGADAGKTAADKYIEWVAGGSSIAALPAELQELALIVNVAEVGRMYGDAPKKLLWFMQQVSGASLAERATLWKDFKKYNEYAYTSSEDPDYVPDDDEMNDDDE